MLMLLAIHRNTYKQSGGLTPKHRGTLGVEVRGIDIDVTGIENKIEPVKKVKSFPRRLIVFALV